MATVFTCWNNSHYVYLARTQTSETGCVCLRRHRMPKDTPPGCSLDSSTDQCMEASSATRPRLVGSGSLTSDGNPSSQSKKEKLSPPRLYVFSTEIFLLRQNNLMDKAPASGAGDSRLESWAAQGYSEWTSVGEVCRVPTLPEHRLPRQDVSACAGTGCPKTRRQPVALTVQLTNAWRLPAPRDHD